ncbi:MAG: CHASE2 domain-containing protein [Alcanivoracaceae bacterium]
MADPLLRHHLRRFHLEHLASTLLLAGFCIALSLSQALAPLDQRIYDRLVASGGSEPDPSILLVMIDEYSLREFGRWPWDRAIHARLIEQLHHQDARAVIYDLLLSEPDTLRPESDQDLARAIADHGRVYLPVHVEQLRGGQLIEALPWRQFAEAAHRLGHVDLVRDEDGLVRSLWLRSGVAQAFWPHIALAVLEDEEPLQALAYQRRSRGQSGARVAMREHPRGIPFARVDYPRVSAADVISGRVPAPLLAGRIVLVGSSVESLGDLVLTPLSPELRVPGVEIHARVLDALMQGRLIETLSPLATVLLGLMVALLAPLWLPFLRPGWTLPLLAGLLLGALTLSALLMQFAQLWWPPAAAMLTVLVAGPLWTWRRLEYSLDYMRRMANRLTRAGEQGGRLAQPAAMEPLLRMFKVLPLKAWRLENRRLGQLQSGGARVEDQAWQGQSARHYPFLRGDEEMELSLLWATPTDADQLEAVVRAMVGRVSAPAPVRGAAFRAVAAMVDAIGMVERRQRGLTRALFASLTRLDQGMLLADACGEVLLANPRLQALLHIDGRPLNGWHVLDLARDLGMESDAWTALIGCACGRGRAEHYLTGRQGEALLLTLRRVEAGGQIGQVLMIELADITEQVHVRRTRSELLHFLSHDLRSPMISILALTEKARQSERPMPANFLDQVDVHARRNLGVAEQFLQLIRVESLERLEMIELDMLPVVESAVDRVGPDARQADVQVRFDYRSDEPVWVRGNHELLERLLINLIGNAVRHSVAGSSVDVRLFCRDGEVCCEVRDRGDGIAPERQAGLFDRLQDNGKGLGLRFVGLVARRHGGRMMLESSPGEGSRFTLALPLLVLDEL